MIKINLTEQQRSAIEERHLYDITQHRFDDFIKIMNNHMPRLRYYLEVHENGGRNLILGNKKKLEEIISCVGCFNKSKNHEITKAYENLRNRNWANDLLRKLNVLTCPYCNRQYTFTLATKDRIRPQFDHYFPVSKYPYLQVSLYNLIPSCSTCNQKKSDKDPYEATKLKKGGFFYPYEEEFGYDANFVVEEFENIDALVGQSKKFKIKLQGNNTEIESKVTYINDIFKLELLYNEHKDYVCDIIKSTIIYNDEKIHELYTDYDFLFDSEEEVRDLIFMGYLKKSDWGERPLSKLTHDIYNDLKKTNTQLSKLQQLRERIELLKLNYIE